MTQLVKGNWRDWRTPLNRHYPIEVKIAVCIGLVLRKVPQMPRILYHFTGFMQVPCGLLLIYVSAILAALKAVDSKWIRASSFNQASRKQPSEGLDARRNFSCTGLMRGISYNKRNSRRNNIVWYDLNFYFRRCLRCFRPLSIFRSCMVANGHFSQA